MKASIVAALAEEIYYNGRVKEGSRKLAYEDFLNLVSAAYGTIMRNVYWQMKQGDPGSELLYFGDSLVETDFTVKIKDPKQRYIDIGESKIAVPFGLGILQIYPTDGGEGCVQPFMKQQPGADWLYCNTDFSVPYYIRKGKRIYLYGNPCVKKDDKVTMDYINFDDDTELQQDIVWDVLNAVLGPVLKVAGWPVDPDNDHNPNTTAAKERISLAQSGQ